MLSNFISFLLEFQSFDSERTGSRLFQKRILRTQFDIYGFIIYAGVMGQPAQQQ